VTVEAVRSAILATAWLLVHIQIFKCATYMYAQLAQLGVYGGVKRFVSFTQCPARLRVDSSWLCDTVINRCWEACAERCRVSWRVD